MHGTLAYLDGKIIYSGYNLRLIFFQIPSCLLSKVYWKHGLILHENAAVEL
jgi:hypothetical protein